MIRALYIGQLWEGGTCLERMRVLREAGWDVVPFDTTSYLRSGNRIWAALQHRLLIGPDVTRFNNDVVKAARTIGRLAVIWVDKGRWLRAPELEEIKRTTGALAFHYTPDPAFTVHTSRHFMDCLPIYDLCITTKRYELDTYGRNGAGKTVFALQGIDDRFDRIQACSRFEGRPIDLMFIGHKEPHYMRVLSVARTVSDSLRIFGPGWLKLSHEILWHQVVGEAVWGENYAAKLAQGRIGLGLLSKMCPDVFTTRSFEIPASGAMLLAERTPGHQELFDEDFEAVFFGSDEELLDKCRFYLKNESARLRIARAGRSRTLSQYRWRQVLRPVIKQIEELVHAR